MPKKSLVWILPAVLALATGGCFRMNKPPDRIEHYMLEYDAPDPGDLAPLSVVVRIERFSVAPPYNSSRIIYRENAFKREAYNYHRWRANPGDQVTNFLGRDFRESGLFKAVLHHDSRFAAVCVLEGAVEEFYERDSADSWEAVLTLSITLVADREPDVSKRVLFQGTYHEVEICERKNPRALTEAMSRAMKRASLRILRDVHAALSDALQGERDS